MADIQDAAVLAPRTDRAVEAADAAARAAGVSIRELTTLDQLHEAYRLFDGVWRPDPSNPPVTTDLLRALTKAGNYVSGAFRDGVLVGACVGFFGAPADRTMHSHLTGVAPDLRGRSVGYALKVHQRAWAMLHGATVISWTFDPLVSRNAYFNLVKLAATPVEYLPNFYGGMRDGINGDDESDRLLMRWRLDAPEVTSACLGRRAPAGAGTLPGAVEALGVSADGLPVTGSARGPVLRVAVPRDVETLRRTDPAAATAWRIAVREVLGGLMADGARVTGFERDPANGWYVVNTTGTQTEAIR